MSLDERWVPVVIKHHGHAFERVVYEKYEVSNRCRIRNAITKKVLSVHKDAVKLCACTIHKRVMRHRVCLASFYPNEIPDNINDHDVDHIDGDHDNNVLTNLQWLLKCEHTRKTVTQTKDNRKGLIENRGKRVRVVGVKGYGDKKILHTIFDSATSAAKKLQIPRNSISSGAKRKNWVGCMYRFEYVIDQMLEGEVFKPIYEYEVSNRGRVKMKSGKIVTGSKLSNSKYRFVNIKIPNEEKFSSKYVHVLVWIAHKGKIPEGLVVMHNDTYNTLDEDGYERNWLEDLSIGTQSENIQNYHNNRKDLKRVRCIETGEEFFSASEAGRKYGINGGHVSCVCQKRRKTVGGKRFEYV